MKKWNWGILGQGAIAAQMAEALMKFETIDAEQIDDIMDGKPPRPPKEPQPKMNGNAGTPPPNAAPSATAPA